jgi:CheY-like chemotaxis protein
MTRYIIFADDDSDDLELITGYFKQFDPSINVLEFKNGKEVLKFLEEFAIVTALPMLVVLDVNMPKINGKETLIAMRKHPKLNKIPVIIYSTSSGNMEADFCKKYAATWVNKPADINQVKNVAKVIADFCLQFNNVQR